MEPGSCLLAEVQRFAHFPHLKNKAVLQPCSRAIRPQALSNRAPRNSSRIVLQRPDFILTNQRSSVSTMSSWSASTGRSEEHTSELQSIISNSYDVFCLKKKKQI